MPNEHSGCRRIRAHVGDDVSDENGERKGDSAVKRCGHMWQLKREQPGQYFSTPVSGVQGHCAV